MFRGTIEGGKRKGGKNMEKDKEKGIKSMCKQVVGQYACVAIPCT